MGTADGARRLHSHVTGVPLPHVLGYEGSEVGGAEVGDAGGEAQEAAGLEVPAVRVVLLGLVRGGGEAVLLHGALQEEQLPVLEVGGAHHLEVVGHEVRHFCEVGGRETDGFFTCFFLETFARLFFRFVAPRLLTFQLFSAWRARVKL